MKSETQNRPYWWIKTVEETLLRADEKPLIRSSHPFDWEKFSLGLSSLLGVKDFKISLEKMEWMTKEDVLRSFVDHPTIQTIVVSPLSEEICWMLDREDLSKLTALLLMKETSSYSIGSTLLQEGYYRFLLLQALSCLNKQEPLRDFSLKLSDRDTLSYEEYFCLDVKISCGEEHLFGKILLSQDFRRAWNEHFASFSSLSKEVLMKDVEVSLALELGYTLLSYDEYHSISIGDFVLLDRCKVDPITLQGEVTIKLGRSPLFQAKIKQNRIQILDLGNYYEDTPMNEKESHEKGLHNKPEEIIAKTVEVEKEESTALGKTPITLTVEVAKIKMTLEKLLELQVGNFLELSVHPDQGVNLTVNGKKVGRAELVHLGEALGIRILEIE